MAPRHSWACAANVCAVGECCAPADYSMEHGGTAPGSAGRGHWLSQLVRMFPPLLFVLLFGAEVLQVPLGEEERRQEQERRSELEQQRS